MSTIRVPEVVPPPKQDAERLKQAFDGIGTDEKAITWVLGRRNASQRQKIKETYQQLYKESLIHHIKSEISGGFRDAVVLWTQDPPERDAKLAKEALKKKSGTKSLQVIVEIACASSPYHLAEVRKTYCSLFECSLEEDIASAVPLPHRKLLLALVSSFRYDKEVVDMGVANSEATRLHEAIKAKQLDHDQVVHILATRNFYQLRATFECYEEKYGNHIEKDIKSCGKGDMVNLLKMVILCIDSPERHFAEVIRTSIVGLGTDEAALNRAIVCRAEVDMKKIKQVYPLIYKDTLDSDVIGDTSGDYQDFLLTLTGSKF
ncbi:Annexin [Melia azedarach]|uniref:Annexin n=1 Tax=Melia azedarach TaxID=155640 RepID=A0ACC1XJG1_MELAZ|nr:Annexin [Melia azedarach]